MVENILLNKIYIYIYSGGDGVVDYDDNKTLHLKAWGKKR